MTLGLARLEATNGYASSSSCFRSGCEVPTATSTHQCNSAFWSSCLLRCAPATKFSGDCSSNCPHCTELWGLASRVEPGSWAGWQWRLVTANSSCEGRPWAVTALHLLWFLSAHSHCSNRRAGRVAPARGKEKAQESAPHKLVSSATLQPCSSPSPQQETMTELPSGSLLWTQKEVAGATSSFSEESRIGEGTFADVYKGQRNNVVYAIKRLKEARTPFSLQRGVSPVSPGPEQLLLSVVWVRTQHERRGQGDDGNAPSLSKQRGLMPCSCEQLCELCLRWWLEQTCLGLELCSSSSGLPFCSSLSPETAADTAAPLPFSDRMHKPKCHPKILPHGGADLLSVSSLCTPCLCVCFGTCVPDQCCALRGPAGFCVVFTGALGKPLPSGAAAGLCQSWDGKEGVPLERHIPPACSE